MEGRKEEKPRNSFLRLNLSRQQVVVEPPSPPDCAPETHQLLWLSFLKPQVSPISSFPPSPSRVFCFAVQIGGMNEGEARKKSGKIERK